MVRLKLRSLYPSTYVVALGTLALVAFMNLCGELYDDQLPFRVWDQQSSIAQLGSYNVIFPWATVQYGWPWPCVRSGMRSNYEGVAIFWPWDDTGWSGAQWDWMDLAANIAVGVFVTVLLSGVWQWRRSRRARLWQFSIRELLGVTALVAMSCGYVAHRAEQVREEQNSLRTLGYRGHIYGSSHAAWCPRWLNAFFPRDSLEKLDRVARLRIASGDIAKIQAFGELKELQVEGALTAPQLLSLCQTLSLESLTIHDYYDDTLHNPNVPYQTPLIFPRQRTPRMLFLDTPQVADETAASLAGNARVSHLTLDAWRITATGAKHLATLSRLKVLDLRSAHQLGDDAIESLAHLPRVESLSIFDSPLTDQGLMTLASMTPLRSLHIANDKVGGDIVVIAPQNDRKKYETKLTPASIARFRAARPDIELTAPELELPDKEQ